MRGAAGAAAIGSGDGMAVDIGFLAAKGSRARIPSVSPTLLAA
jgi:hypothetical protein